MPSLILLPICLLIILTLIFSELIRDNQISLDALMHDQVLVSFSSLKLQGSFPNVAADVAELTGLLQDLEMVHQSESDLGLLFGFLDHLEGFVVVEVAECFIFVHAFEEFCWFDVASHGLELVVN